MIGGDAPPDGSHGPHLLVEDLSWPEISPEDRHHLERVCRVRSGDPATLGDGRGRWMPVRWGSCPEPVGEIRSVPEPRPRLGVAFALVKGGRNRSIVRKLVELGVDDIRPFSATRSIVRWDPAQAHDKHLGLTMVVRESVMQCRRAWIPRLHRLATFEEVAALPSAALARLGGAPLSAETRLILIGPEGGWDAAETSWGLPDVELSKAVLRAETASIAAAAMLVASQNLSGVSDPRRERRDHGRIRLPQVGAQQFGARATETRGAIAS